MEIQKSTVSHASTLEQLFSVLYKPELNWSEGKLRDEIQTGKKVYYLAMEENEVVGAFGIKFDGLTAKFGPLSVKPAYRNKGIGSGLINFAERLSIDMGLERIWCYSFERYNVKNFYLSNGWKEEKFIQDFWDGQNCFIYAKGL